MAKIQNIGIGKYIRNPKGRKASDSTNVEVLQIAENHGNAYLCFPVTGRRGTDVILDKTRYLFIPIDSNVNEVTIS